MQTGCVRVKTAVVSMRRWAVYGGLVAAVYTGISTFPDLQTRSFALYSGKMAGSIIAGIILGCVAARVRNRYAQRAAAAADPDASA